MELCVSDEATRAKCTGASTHAGKYYLRCRLLPRSLPDLVARMSLTGTSLNNLTKLNSGASPADQPTASSSLSIIHCICSSFPLAVFVSRDSSQIPSYSPCLVACSPGISSSRDRSRQSPQLVGQRSCRHSWRAWCLPHRPSRADCRGSSLPAQPHGPPGPVVLLYIVTASRLKRLKRQLQEVQTLPVSSLLSLWHLQHCLAQNRCSINTNCLNK